jgi:outer membrane lipoprotein carrier protein
VHFTESYAGVGTSRTEEGTLLLSKPSAMRWDYEQPNRKLFLIDGKFAYFYVVGDSKAEKIDARKIDDLRSPLRFLLGRTHLASELTNLQLTRSSVSDFDLEGVPKGMENRVAKVTITATSGGEISSLRIEERDGAITTFKFSDFDTNPHLAPGTFHFEPPAGVTIVQGSFH